MRFVILARYFYAKSAMLSGRVAMIAWLAPKNAGLLFYRRASGSMKVFEALQLLRKV